MSVGERKGNLYVDDFTEYANIADEWSPVLEYRVPASEWFMFRNDKPINLFVPAKQVLDHGGTGEETFDIDYKLVDSAALDDEETAFVDSSDGFTLDYDNNQVTVDHDTDENLDLFYLLGEGNLEIRYIPPIAQGSAHRKLLSKSLLSLHAVNQFGRNSAVYLNRVGLVPEKHKIQIWVKTSATIEYPSGYEVGAVKLPYKARPRTAIPSGTEQEIIESLTN